LIAYLIGNISVKNIKIRLRVPKAATTADS